MRGRIALKTARDLSCCLTSTHAITCVEEYSNFQAISPRLLFEGNLGQEFGNIYHSFPYQNQSAER